MASGLPVGLNKGYLVEARPADKNRPMSRKGIKNKRVAAIRDIIREVTGLAPYEKRVLDILKGGGGSAEKRAYKFAKKRLGTHKRAIKKREEMKNVWARSRAKQ